MAKTDSSTGANTPGPKQPFTFYAANGRLYASNVAQKLIDLGALQQQDGGWAYLLDGNKEGRSGFANAQAALRDVASRIRFLYLDGQFTAVADARASVNLDGAERLDAMIDELQPGEPAVDATV
jgi:hypothetical protein